VNGFDLPDPFVWDVTAQAEHLDVFGHVTQAVYLAWLTEASWAHSRGDKLDEEICLAERRGMALIRSEVDYLGHGRAGDDLQVAVWITKSDERLRAERRFQIVRPADGATLLRARWDLVCFNLDSGKPARMPDSFVAHYRASDHIAGG
jgi:acyl-CoA thioester hydrolase